MMKNETVPEYKVNYVRVYQNPNNPKQKVGCSTPERPTKQYIKAHEELYKTVNDVSVVPIKGFCWKFYGQLIHFAPYKYFNNL